MFAGDSPTVDHYYTVQVSPMVSMATVQCPSSNQKRMTELPLVYALHTRIGTFHRTSERYILVWLPWLLDSLLGGANALVVTLATIYVYIYVYLTPLARHRQEKGGNLGHVASLCRVVCRVGVRLPGDMQGRRTSPEGRETLPGCQWRHLARPAATRP